MVTTYLKGIKVNSIEILFFKPSLFREDLEIHANNVMVNIERSVNIQATGVIMLARFQNCDFSLGYLVYQLYFIYRTAGGQCAILFLA